MASDWWNTGYMSPKHWVIMKIYIFIQIYMLMHCYINTIYNTHTENTETIFKIVQKFITYHENTKSRPIPTLSAIA